MIQVDLWNHCGRKKNLTGSTFSPGTIWDPHPHHPKIDGCSYSLGALDLPICQQRVLVRLCCGVCPIKQLWMAFLVSSFKPHLLNKQWNLLFLLAEPTEDEQKQHKALDETFMGMKGVPSNLKWIHDHSHEFPWIRFEFHGFKFQS
jgi:hypothetical protein